MLVHLNGCLSKEFTSNKGLIIVEEVFISRLVGSKVYFSFTKVEEEVAKVLWKSIPEREVVLLYSSYTKNSSKHTSGG